MANLIKLKIGKAIGAFDGFVETFNWLVDFCQNLKGNGEEYNSTGSDEDRNGIVVDRSVPDHPVIRGGGSEVNVDDVSIGTFKDPADDKKKIEIKGFRSASAATPTLVQLLTTNVPNPSSEKNDFLERNTVVGGPVTVKYRQSGSLKSGDNTRVVLSDEVGNTGSVKIDVYPGTKQEETLSVAQLMTTSNSSTTNRSLIGRNSGASESQPENSVEFRKFGSIESGDDTKVTFENGTNGSVEMEVSAKINSGNFSSTDPSIITGIERDTANHQLKVKRRSCNTVTDSSGTYAKSLSTEDEFAIEEPRLSKEPGVFSLVSGSDSNLKFTTTTSIETGEDGSDVEVKTCAIDVYYV